MGNVKLKCALIKLLNPFISVGTMFLIIILLYLFSFSKLYTPDLFYAIFLLSLVALLFLLNTLTNQINLARKVNLLIRKIEINKVYILITIIFFLTGTFANYYEYTKVGWPCFLENKVTKGENIHYIHYITNFLIYSLIMAYIGYRESNKFIKVLLFSIFIVSLFELLVWLNRGPMLFLLIVAGLYEFLRSLKHNRVYKFIRTVIIMSVLFIIAFEYIGNTRVAYVTENIYGYSVNEQYGMPEWFPTSLTWIYIYATSPLENFRDIFYNQSLSSYRYGMLLFYPFVTPVYKSLFGTEKSTYPYLDDIAGLNVSSFMNDAFNDFYILGPYIYILFTAFMFLIALKLFSRGIYGFLSYASILNMGMWNFFVNGFAIGPFMIGFIIFSTLCLFMEGKSNVNKTKCKEEVTGLTMPRQSE